MWKRTVSMLALSFVISAFGIVGCGPKVRQMTIGTASMGGAYYPVGSGIAEVVNKYVKSVKLTAEVTGGGVENPRLVATGQADLGITNADTGYFAYTGTEMYKDKKLDIRAITALHPSTFHIVTLAKSSINTIFDLKGKRVAVGPAGGGSVAMLNNLLPFYGMTINDIRPSYVSYSDGTTALKDGNVDVALALAGHPTSAVMELATTTKLKFVSFGPGKIEEIVKKFPYYTKVVVPKDLYKMDEDAVTTGVMNILIASPNLDEKTAYLITQSIFEHLDELHKFHASLKQVTLEEALNVPIPLHPGAEKYFREKGTTK